MFDLAQLKELGGYKAGDLLAVDPQLYSKFMQHLSRTVKHDRVTKDIVFHTCLSAFTASPINLFLKGPSSIGKTYNPVETLKYFPEEDVWHLGALSPTALVHDYGKLLDANGEEIQLRDKPEKPKRSDYSDDYHFREALGEYKENHERWIKRLEKSRYLVDLSNKVLMFLEAPQIRTFHMLRPILSHDRPEISYKFTDKTARGKLQTQHVVIKGWPATIFCSTQEKYVQDLATRSFTVTPDTVPEKYRDANILTGDKAAYPWKLARDFDFTLLEAYIRFLRKNACDIKIIVPYASELGKMFPAQAPRSMRDFKHIVSLIEVHTLFHFAQRPVLARKFKGEDGSEVTERYVMATRQDCDFIMDLWSEIRETTETGAPGHILKFFREVVEKVAEEKIEFVVTDLVEEWNSRFTPKRSSDTIRTWVNYLCDIGRMTKIPHPKDKRFNLLQVIIHDTGEIQAFQNADIFTLDSLKAWLSGLKSISAASTLFIANSFVDMREASIEDIYKKYFAVNAVNAAVIDLGDSTASSSKGSVELRAFQNAHTSPVSCISTSICKLEDLKDVYWSEEFYGEHECCICGIRKQTSWQAETFKSAVLPICEDCKLEWDKKQGEV